MVKKKKILFIAICVLVFTFCWGLFFTIGLPFFWEDFGSYSIGVAKNPNTISTIFKSSITEFFATKRLFKIAFSALFSDRPYQYLTNSFLGILFGHQVVFYRTFKSLFLAMIAFLIFFVMTRASIMFALLGVALYITSSEVWAILASSMDVAIYSQFTTLLSIVIFLRLVEKVEQRKIALWLEYAAILIISQYSVLSKNDGRYLAIIFFLTLFFFQRKKLSLHLPMLAMLFIFEVPILGYIRNILTGERLPIINLASHNSLSLITSLKAALKNYIFPLNAAGKIIMVVFLFAISAHLYYLVFHRKKDRVKILIDPLLRWRSFLFFLWFICSVIMITVSRKFSYEGLADISVGECSYFILPFSIFIGYYLCLLSSYFSKNYRYLFIVFCAILISAEVLIFRLPRLNNFRGGWGNYFCAWDNAKLYINKKTDNGLVLAILEMRYTPFMFWESNNQIIPNIFVQRMNFSKIVEDEDGIFGELVKNGYLDEQGIIQNKFRALNDESEMILSIGDTEKRKEIFKVLSVGFISSAEKCPFGDLIYIEGKFTQKVLKDIFVVSREAVNFKNKSKQVILNDETIVDGDSRDLYDRFKRFIGRPSRPILHIYHFKPRLSS